MTVNGDAEFKDPLRYVLLVLLQAVAMYLFFRGGYHLGTYLSASRTSIVHNKSTT